MWLHYLTFILAMQSMCSNENVFMVQAFDSSPSSILEDERFTAFVIPPLIMNAVNSKIQIEQKT